MISDMQITHMVWRSSHGGYFCNALRMVFYSDSIPQIPSSLDWSIEKECLMSVVCDITVLEERTK